MQRPLHKITGILLAGVLACSPVFLSTAAAADTTVDFTLPDLDNNPISLSDFRGKWVIVNYWATWCPPCLAEIPELIDFHEEHKDRDAVVLGVDFEDIPLNELVQFTEEYFMNYPNVQMKPAARSHLGIIEGLPTTFMISPGGKLLAKQTGPVSRALLEEFIRENSAADTSTPVKQKAGTSMTSKK